jgi:hypothetical protein
MKLSLIAKTLRLLVYCSVAFPLAGCPNTLSPPDPTTAALIAACQQYAPVLNGGTAPAAPTSVSSIAIFGQVYCQQLLSSGVAPATTNSNTLSWLPSVVNGVKTAAQIAMFVLPLL